MNFATLPAGATLSVRPFKAQVADEKLEHFRRLLELSPVGPAVFENTNAGRKYGITRAWLEMAKSAWLNDFDWRKCEDRFNSFPNFKAIVQDPAGNSIDIHFLALFSQKEDAVPIAFFHGWPGSICEFLDILDLLRSRYSPKHLPYHVIVPSLPGYAYSSGPPLHADYGLEAAAGALDSLMAGLGFRDGYLAQGGDLGSFVSRILAMTSDSCLGIHLNMMGMPLTEDIPGDEAEAQALQKAKEAVDTGLAFALEHGTRPATIGMALSSSPLALLCW